MNDGNQLRKPRRRRRLLWGVCVVAGLVVLAATTAWWIMIRMPGTSYCGELPDPDAALVRLTEELGRDAQHLAVDIGERNVFDHPKELTQAADYLESQFRTAGYDVKRQEYEVSDAKCRNLEVEILGTVRPDEIVVVGAHYDTHIGTPGANDNTSGIAGLLALARRFSKCRTDRSVRFVAFVNEEGPYFHTDKMGSRVYARRCQERGEQIVAMMSLETIGYYDDNPRSQKYPAPFGTLYPSEGNFIGFIGNTASRHLVRQVVRTFRQNEPFPSEGSAPPESVVPGVGLSDQWSFWQEGYPALMVTDTAMFRYPYYHEPEDTIDKVDFERMARVVRGLEKVVAELVGVE